MALGKLETEGDAARWLARQLEEPGLINYQRLANKPDLSTLGGTGAAGVARISASNSTFSGTVRITGGPNITVGTDASGVSMSAAAGGVGAGADFVGIQKWDVD